MNALVTSLRNRVCWGGSLASMLCATAECRRRGESLPAKKTTVSSESPSVGESGLGFGFGGVGDQVAGVRTGATGPGLHRARGPHGRVGGGGVAEEAGQVLVHQAGGLGAPFPGHR